MRRKQYEEEHVYDRDVHLAEQLLQGFLERDSRGLFRLKYSSANTRPTEKDARSALRRVLRRGNVPFMILWHLANLFDPTDAEQNPRKVVFKKLSQGHADTYRDSLIAADVECTLRDMPPGRGRKSRAYVSVGERLNISPEQVRRICDKQRKRHQLFIGP